MQDWLFSANTAREIETSTLRNFYSGPPQTSMASFLMYIVTQPWKKHLRVQVLGFRGPYNGIRENSTTINMAMITTYLRVPPVGALTTIETYPCGPLTNAEWGSGDTTLYDNFGSPIPTSCVPSGFALDVQYGQMPYWSPAICPSGYYPACTWWTNNQGPPPLPTETAWNCLPS